MKKIISLIFGTFFVCLSAFGSSDTGKPIIDEVTIAGVGTSSCAVYVNFYDDNSARKVSFTTWATGFISGLNVYRSSAGFSNITVDVDALELLTYRYCNDNPLSYYFDSVLNYVNLVNNKQV